MPLQQDLNDKEQDQEREVRKDKIFLIIIITNYGFRDTIYFISLYLIFYEIKKKIANGFDDIRSTYVKIIF